MLHRLCNGQTRRDFLCLGAAGLSLAQLMRLAEAQPVPARTRSAIFIYQSGGPSHLDSFDPKPDAPVEYRGEFNSIATRVPGLRLSEHLPRLAACADQFAFLRGVSHNLADHSLGQKYLATGNRPIVSLDYPGYAAMVAKELPCDRDLPPAVGIPFSSHGTGFLGLQYSSFDVGAMPQAGRPFQVRGVDLQKGRSPADYQRWRSLRNDLDRSLPELGDDNLAQGLDRFSQRAFDLVQSPRTRQAFDLTREAPAIVRDFGDDPVCLSLLLACRLVEAGVRFVTVHKGGWDTHQDNFGRLRNEMLPPIDRGVSALLRTLTAKGLLATTTVFLTGEFGRTPRISNRNGGGRDHWPRAMTCLLAGGGIRGGQVIGASDARGEGPATAAITPDDVAASFYHSLGIDVTRENHTTTGRPIMIVRDGRRIPALGQ